MIVLRKHRLRGVLVLEKASLMRFGSILQWWEVNILTALQFQRYVGYAEGTSFLLLLGIAMPLKYAADIPEGVEVVGMLHGLLFILFCHGNCDLLVRLSLADSVGGVGVDLVGASVWAVSV